MNKVNVFKLVAISLLATACASPNQRNVVETGAQEARPEWVSSTRVTWTDKDQVLFRSQYTIRGDERVNGCYELARLESKAALLREIAEDIRGQVDSAQQGLSESAELVLSEARSSEFSGRVTGFRYLEQYHERYRADGTERVDCFVLGSMSRVDYDSVRRAVILKIAAVDPELKKAIQKKQIRFFEPERAPAEAQSLVKEVSQ